MTALLGWLPPFLCLLAIHFALEHGAHGWPSIVFDITFVGLYLSLLAFGAWVYGRWFRPS